MKDLISFCAGALLLHSALLADFYDFTRVTSNSSTILDQLRLDVTDAGGGQVDFTLTNSVGVPSVIVGVYFDDNAGVLTQTLALKQSPQIRFSPWGSPANLPGGNSIGFSADDRITANSPSSSMGLNSADDWLMAQFSLVRGKTFDDVLSALNNQTLRVGLDVRTIGADGQGDSYVTSSTLLAPQPVPVPAAAALGLIGCALVGVRPKRTVGPRDQSP